MILLLNFFFFSSRRRHTRCSRDWSSDVCSSDLRLYAGMTGQRISTTGSDPTKASAFATRDDATGTVSVLFGRHESCTPKENELCHQAAADEPQAAQVNLQVAYPYSASQVKVSYTKVQN